MMPDHTLGTIIRHLGRPPEGGGPGAISDTELIRRYTTLQDAAAFELIVWRHGVTVWNACRRSLFREQDAEDAFQAVFLVLARKARALRRGECLGGWLHHVAVRVSRRLMARTCRIGNREQPLGTAEPIASECTISDWPDVRPAVDEEIDRLPAKYRTAFILCHLQGQTCEQAAQKLGCPRGTILSRLSRARERLKDRLTRRGITLSTTAFAALANGTVASAARIESTTHAALAYAVTRSSEGVSTAAATLSQEIVTTMLLNKLKWTCCALVACLGIGTLGIEGLKHYAAGDEPVRTSFKEPASAKTLTDLDKIQGAWNVEYVITDGKKDDDEGVRLIFAKDTFHIEKSGREAGKYGFVLDPNAKVKTIDIDKSGRSQLGIYELDGDKLRICYQQRGEGRPTKFESTPGTNLLVVVMNRDKPGVKAKVPAVIPDRELENRRLRDELEQALRQARVAEAEAREQRDQAERAKQLATVARVLAEKAQLEAENARRLAEVERARAEKERDAARKEIEALRKALELQKEKNKP